MQNLGIKSFLIISTLLTFGILNSIKADENQDAIQYSKKNEFFKSANKKNLASSPYFEMAAGTALGVKQTYFTLGNFTSILLTDLTTSSSRLSFYNDTCWHHFLKGTNGASVESGIIRGNDFRSFGGYIGYDWRRWDGHSFHQISGGFQMKCCPWEVFLNFNCPLQNDITICSAQFEYEGGYNASLIEFDATYRIISVNVARSFCTCLPNIGVTVGIEPYFLESESKKLCSRNRKSWGGKARLLFNVCCSLNVEASISHDSIFNSRGQIVLGIDLLQLFCNCSNDNNCYNLPNIFRRQRLIAIKHKESWKHNW